MSDDSGVEVRFHDKKVLVLSTADLLSSSSSSFPGNDTDSQFHVTHALASSSSSSDVDTSRYSCSYTGKHDHGDLLPQSATSVAHLATLRFLSQARAQTEAFFVQQNKQQQQQQ